MAMTGAPIPLKLFDSLAEVDKVRLISLQVGPGTDQLKTVTFPIADLGSRFDPNSLTDLAAVLMNMDLVVTVDTSVAHLAGAMGIPVWVLLPVVPDWHGCWNEPTVLGIQPCGLFRQRRRNDWDEVFTRIAAELRLFSPVLRAGAKQWLFCYHLLMPTIAELFQLAARHHQGGNLAQAEPLYRQVLQADPANALANYMLGLLAHQSGHHEAALTLLRRALTLKPDLPGAHFNLGVVLMSLQRFSEAADFLRRSLATDPHQVEAYINLGNAYMNLGQFLDASKCYRERCTSIRNIHMPLRIWGTRSITWGSLCKLKENCMRPPIATGKRWPSVRSVRMFSITWEAFSTNRAGLKTRPNVTGKRCNFSLKWRTHTTTWVLFTETRLGLLLPPNVLRKALQIDPSHKLALWNRCLSRLRHGDFEQGWPDFELRWAQPGMVPRSFDKPRWDGSPLRGKTILVYAEHGLGDTIQFMRYLPLVQHLVGKVIFECQVALFGLLSNIKGIDLLIPAGMPLPLFDVHVSLLSLPSFFLQPHAFIPNEIPYLVADPKRVEHWRRNLQSMPGFKVGISWQGSLNQKNDCRSIPLAEFMPLGWLENCHLISLQVGAGTDQLRSWAGSYPIVEISDRLGAVATSKTRRPS